MSVGAGKRTEVTKERGKNRGEVQREDERNGQRRTKKTDEISKGKLCFYMPFFVPISLSHFTLQKLNLYIVRLYLFILAEGRSPNL